MVRPKHFIVPALVAGLLMFSAHTTPATADVVSTTPRVPDSCTTDTSSSDPGADLCTFTAGNFYPLNWTDAPEFNVTANDGLPAEKASNVADIGELDSSIATFELYKDSAGNAFYDVIVSPDFVGTFTTEYQDALGNWHTLTANVQAYVPPPTYVGPSVTLGTHKGRLKVCEPSAESGGADITWMYGSFDEKVPDGQRVVHAGTCRTVRVHRHRIDWLAIDPNGNIAAQGSIKHIPLPAGDHQPTRPVMRLSNTMSTTWWRTISH